MKKLLGIVAVVALLAVPAMAQLQEQNVGVSINVVAYCEVEDPPDLSFTVSGPYYVGGPAYGDSQEFNVRTNADSTLTVTASDTSEATAAPGTGYYPTASATINSVVHKIGFGVALTNLVSQAYGPWDEQGPLPAGEAKVTFAPSLTSDPAPNARITVNSYMDSARGTDKLAPVGLYTASLILTVAIL